MSSRSRHPRVAVILLSYNGRKFLENCIPSILKQDYPALDIFMVDNDSHDDSVAFVRKNYSSVKVLESGSNLGFGPGFNYGLRKVINDYPYAVLLSNDTVLDKRCVSHLITPLSRESRVAICTSLVLSYDGKQIDNAGGTVVNLLAGVVGGYLGNKGSEDIKRLKKSAPFPVSFGIAAAMAVSCSVLKEIGLFDESFFIYYDDIDLSWRAWRRGYRVLCNPQAVIYHYGAASPKTKDLSRFILKRVENNVLACYYKNLDLWLVVLLLPLVCLFRGGGLLFYFLVSPRVALAKIEGWGQFMSNFTQYRELRRKEARFWEKSGLEILRNNQGSLFSLKVLVDNLVPWFREMKSFAAGRRLVKHIPETKGDFPN